MVRQSRQPRPTGDSELKDLLEAQPAPHESASFDIEYPRQLLHWATEQIRDEFSTSPGKAFWLAGVEGGPPGRLPSKSHNGGTVYQYKSQVMARLRKKN